MRGPRPSAHLVRFSVFELDVRCGELRKSGIRIPLQDQPFRVLALLVEHPGELVTREELRELLWPAGTFVDFDHGLNTAVRRLRDALGDSAETPRFIETVPRRGYRFIAPVLTTAAESEAPAPQLPEGHHRRRRIAAAAGAAVAFVGVSVVTLSLRHPSPLSERDRVLLADLVNRTDDAAFDGTLTRALAVKLEESPFLSIVSEERVRETLRLMDRSADEPVTPRLGREVCIRQGVKAMIEGELVRLDNGYVVNLTAVECATGEVLARAQDEAVDKASVLHALGRAGARLRANLGEQLLSVPNLDKPLPEATTASLEALKAFTLGERERARGRTREAIPFYTRAIELDPEFALAYARLAALHSNIDQFARAAEYAARAFEGVNRVSERERLYILDAYNWFVSFDDDKRRDVIALWVKTYPRDGRAVQRLALYHIARDECDKGLEHALEQMRLQPDAFAYGTLTLAYQCLGRFEEARAVAERAIETDVDLPYLRVLLYQVALALGDHATMARQVEWAVGRPTEHLIRREQAHASASTGRMGEARAFLAEAIGIARANQFSENAGAIAASAAVMEALTGDVERAQDRAAEAIGLSRNEVTLLWAGLVLGLTKAAGAQKVLEQLPGGQYPVLPVPWARAAFELGRDRPEGTIEVLRLAARYEPVDGTPFSQYLRGEAYLRLDRPADAVRELRKLVDRPAGVRSSPHIRENWRPLLRVVAHARLGQAYARAGEIEKARDAYQRFLDLWKDADPDVPLLKSARAAHAALAAASEAR